MTATTSPMPTLDRREWQVVTLALREAEECGCGGITPPSRLSRLWTALTGNEPARPLANPRLETLRRYVCGLRWNDEGVEKLGRELIGLGYSQSQVDVIAALDRA